MSTIDYVSYVGNIHSWKETLFIYTNENHINNPLIIFNYYEQLSLMHDA